MIVKQEDYVILKMKTNKKNNIFNNLLRYKAYLRKKVAWKFTYSVILFFLNIDNILVVFICVINNYVISDSS